MGGGANGSSGEGHGWRRLHAKGLFVYELARVVSVHGDPQEVAAARGWHMRAGSWGRGAGLGGRMRVDVGYACSPQPHVDALVRLVPTA